MYKKALILLLAVGVLTLGPMISTTAESLTEVVYFPAWIDHWENAGPLVAIEKRFYEEEGLKVVDKPGGPGLNPLNRMLSSKKIAFATYYDEFVFKAREERGVDLKVVATDFQSPALHLISWAPIDSKEDLFDKKVEVWPGYDYPLRSFLGKDQDKVEILNQGGSMERFLAKQVNASSAMIYNELILVLNRLGVGIENYKPDKVKYTVNLDEKTDSRYKKIESGDHFYVYRYGQLDPDLTWNENSLVTTTKTLQKHPEVIKGFVHATYKGWRWAMTHDPQEVAEILTKFNSSLDPDHEIAGGKQIDKIMIDKNVCEYGLGYLDFTAWKPMVEKMFKAGLLKEEPTEKEIWSSFHYIPSKVFPPKEACE